METQKNPSEAPARQEFTFERVLHAPRKLVFEAYSQVEHLKNWWGPKDMPITVFNFDFQQGGSFFYGMALADGGFSYGKLTYTEITSPEKIAFLTSFTDADGNPIRHPMAANWPLEVHTTTTFIEEDDQTRVVSHTYPVNAQADEVALFESAFAGMTQGNNGMFDNFAAYLETLNR